MKAANSAAEVVPNYPGSLLSGNIFYHSLLMVNGFITIPQK
jgi:hypothetical protein